MVVGKDGRARRFLRCLSVSKFRRFGCLARDYKQARVSEFRVYAQGPLSGGGGVQAVAEACEVIAMVRSPICLSRGSAFAIRNSVSR